jgi:hypothetical protein
MKRDERSAGMVLVVAAVASQVIVLVAWGHVAYLWVQGVEALVGAVFFTAFAIRYRAHDPRPGRWPPLLPLAAIAGSGGVKDLLVALDRPTPVWLVVVLLGSVIWFVISSWLIWRAAPK